MIKLVLTFFMVMKDELPANPHYGPGPDLRGQLFTSNTNARTLGQLGTSQDSLNKFRSIVIIYIIMKRCSDTVNLKNNPMGFFSF